MSQPYPVKMMCVIVAAVSLAVATLAATARQQDAQPQPEPPAQTPNEAPGDTPPSDAPPADAPAADAPAADAPPAAPTPEERATATPAEEADAPFVEPVLAERLYEMAQSLLRQEHPTEPMWRQSAALLRAASRLSPKDPRFPRLLIEARLKVGETDGAIEALTAYRRVDPADRVAQIQLIDLYVQRMQTADQRLSYLRELLERETIPQEVRSHVAAQCAHLLLERSQEEAAAMVEESLKLFPLNPDALRTKLEMLPDDAAPAARASVLMAIMRSNPTQPGAAEQLARVLATVGLHKESLEWYTVAMGLYPRVGEPFPPGFVGDAGAQVLLAGLGEQLDALLGSYLKARPDDADAWFLKLVKDKSAATDKLDPKAIDAARAAMSANLSQVCTAINGAGAGGAPGAAAPAPNPAAPATGGPALPPGAASSPAPTGAAPPGGAPTTRPATPAEAIAAATRVKAGEAAEWEPALVSTLTDLAWLEIYFAEDAAAAANWVGALRELVPADSVTLARLDGWVDLVSGNAEQAKTKLSAIGDQDPIAAIGLVRVSAKDAGGEAAATELATRLLSNFRTGLVAAMVWSDLHNRHIKLPEPEGVADVRAELQKFPRDWMEIINQPEAYYEVIADVVKVAHRYREPMLGRITIRNKTDYDLTIGPDGVIRPDLWIDAKITGLVNRSFPGVAYDRISRRIVLPARDTHTQFVRIDQGPLADALEQNPSASAQISANVLTNPSPLASGIGPGPGGQRRGFNKAFIRSGFALSQIAMRKRAITAIQTGSQPEKMRGLDLLAGYVRALAAQKNIDDAGRKIILDFATAIASSRSDASKPVAMWAAFLTARLVENGRDSQVDTLAADEAWPARLLGLVAASDLGPQRQTELAAKLAEKDADPTVKEYAAATVEVLRSGPATQPATAEAAQGPGQSGEAQTTGASQPRDTPAPRSEPSTTDGPRVAQPPR